MRRRPLLFLLLCNSIPLFVGMGLFPLLPLYAAQFGASHTIIGVYYAVTYASSVAGIAVTSWLGERLPRHVVFVIGGALGVPALALLGHATALWQVVLLTGMIWFSGAITIALVNVFTGLIAESGQRGVSFSLMVVAYPLGAIMGSSAVSQLVTWYGYAPMFTVLAAVWTILPLLGALGLGGIQDTRTACAEAVARTAPPLGPSFRFLLAASLLAAIAINVGRLGISLSMESMAFSASAIGSTGLVSGLIAAPLTLFIGWVSDRVGHQRLLMLGYALAIGGAVVLLDASQLWHFWVAATLLFLAWCVNSSVSTALAANTLAPEALGRGLPRLNAMDSFGSIVGFASAGYILDTFGATTLYCLAAVLVALAAPVLSLVTHRGEKRAGVPRHVADSQTPAAP